jgi:protein tyrosine phosphatase (PTP) superfamily phosphohydrolase (DUF442 family)
MTTAFQAIQGVVNACQALPNLVTGGQPDLRHLEALRNAGVRVVLDIRAPQEPRAFAEPAATLALGMEYVVIPVGTTPLSDELMEKILTVLRDHSGDPVFFHCASGNRVGGALIPFFIIDHGMDEEDAIAMATRVGLRSRELLSWGLDYARRHGSAGAEQVGSGA